MKFFQKRGDTSTIRKVVSDDKAIRYGVVGTIEDLLAARILEYCDGKPEMWMFIPFSGYNKAHIGKTRAEAVEELSEGENEQ